MTTRKGTVQTVLGLIEPSNLGITHMHEHIFINYLDFFLKPTEQEQSCCCVGHSEDGHKHVPLEDQKINIKNVHWVQYNYNKNLHNLQLDEEDVALAELELYKKCGGKTILDVTTEGIGRDPERCRKVSMKLGLNIVVGAGYYLEKTIGKLVSNTSVEEMEEKIVKQVLEGIDGTDIKAGIIGEVGCSSPLSANEKKSLIASARAQKRTGVSITIHPGRTTGSPMEILNILKDNGADLSRVVMGHIDRTIHDINVMYEIAKTGCTLEFDLFGMEISYYPFGGDVMGMASDNQRIDWIKSLIDAGYGQNIVISQDIYTKHRLVTYGGHGYHHILFNIVPRMLKHGITQANIDDILINNPKRILTIV